MQGPISLRTGPFVYYQAPQQMLRFMQVANEVISLGNILRGWSRAYEMCISVYVYCIYCIYFVHLYVLLSMTFMHSQCNFSE